MNHRSPMLTSAGRDKYSIFRSAAVSVVAFVALIALRLASAFATSYFASHRRALVSVHSIPLYTNGAPHNVLRPRFGLLVNPADILSNYA